MYNAIPTQSSCARAWVAASNAVIQAGDEDFNVLIDVSNPTKFDAADDLAISLVDTFLREHEQEPIASVVNTIFPQALYDAHGVPEFYEQYINGFNSLSSKSKLWGRYFQRMAKERTGKDGVKFRSIERIIERMKGQQLSSQTFRAAYEISLYDAETDSKRFMQGPCLSHLSFKLHQTEGLLLTAVYRNHYYVTRCLGNLIGLGRLMGFVATEAGVKVGSLTVVSTHAEIDRGSKGKWGIVDARNLVAHAKAIVESGTTAFVQGPAQ